MNFTPADIQRQTVADGDCLRWTGRLQNGHPCVSQQGRTVLVRRALWEQDRGPIPAGKVLRVTCGMRACLNPEHWRLTTYKSIALECGAVGLMSGHLRSAKIAATKRAGKQAKVTDDQVREIRASAEPGTVLAARHGVSEAFVCRVRQGKVRREFASPFAGLVAARA